MKRLSLILLAALAATAVTYVHAQRCVARDDGTGTVSLPPEGCPYIGVAEFHMIVDGLPPGTTIEVDPIHRQFVCTGGTPGHCGTPGGALGGETESFDSTLFLRMRGTGDLDGFEREVAIPISCVTHTAPRTPGDAVQTFQTDMFQLQGVLPPGDPDFQNLQVVGGTNFGLPSPGQTTLTRLPDGNFNVDSFFDIAYQIDFQGAPGGVLAGLSGSTMGTVRMGAGEPILEDQLCVVDDNGSGTVNLPPQGCGYVSPADLHLMINGLPAGTMIEVDPIHRNFVCVGGSPNNCGVPGGGLGGEVETFDSELHLVMNGTGALAGFSREITVPIRCVTHTGARNPGDPVQTFPTDMFQLQGELFGDPDFQLLRITGGSDVVGPSPGVATLTELPTGQFNVDSFFDIAYRIEFEGAPGSVLDGLSGTTQGEVEMRTGAKVNPPQPCLAQDDGTGTVSLPPEGCPYLSAQEVHEIIDGLPPGTEIELAPIHRGFVCQGGGPDRCGTPGGSLGGEVEVFNSTLDLQLTGTGGLAGLNRVISLPVQCVTHTGPRDPTQKVQGFQNVMFRLEGGLSGDPDFASLSVIGGNDFGLISPGLTRVTRLPDGQYAVDSFFNLTYQIDFQGAPGGALDGLAGSTTAQALMRAGDGKPHQFFYPFWPQEADMRDIVCAVPPPSFGLGDRKPAKKEQ